MICELSVSYPWQKRLHESSCRQRDGGSACCLQVLCEFSASALCKKCRCHRAFPPAHNCMKRSIDDAPHHPHRQVCPAPAGQHGQPGSRPNVRDAPSSQRRNGGSVRECLLSEPRFEPLDMQQATQAVELLARLIAAAACGRDDHDGRPVDGRRVSGRQRDDDAGRWQPSRVANCCTSDWQAQRRENGLSVGVSGGSPAPDCIGKSRSSRCS